MFVLFYFLYGCMIFKKGVGSGWYGFYVICLVVIWQFIVDDMGDFLDIVFGLLCNICVVDVKGLNEWFFFQEILFICKQVGLFNMFEVVIIEFGGVVFLYVEFFVNVIFFCFIFVCWQVGVMIGEEEFEEIEEIENVKDVLFLKVIRMIFFKCFCKFFQNE